MVHSGLGQEGVLELPTILSITPGQHVEAG